MIEISPKVVHKAGVDITTWHHADSNLDSGEWGCVYVLPSGRILAGGGRETSGKYKGLWYSDDNGETWSNIIESGTQKLYVTPTGTILGAAGPYGQGLKYSNDNGETWAALISNMKVDAVCITANGRMIIGNNQGINYSDDNGETITHVFIQSGEGDISGVDSIVELDNELFLSCDYGVYHSTDNGESWSLVETTWGTARKLCVSSTGRLAVIRKSSSTTPGIYYSDDKGVTWSYSQESGEYGSSIDNLCAVSTGKIFASASGSNPALLCSDLVTEIQKSYTSKPLTGAQAKQLVAECKEYVQGLKNSL